MYVASCMFEFDIKFGVAYVSRIAKMTEIIILKMQYVRQSGWEIMGWEQKKKWNQVKILRKRNGKEMSA